MEKAGVSAAATDNKLTELIRYDSNLVNESTSAVKVGITNAVKENKVTDIILGLRKQHGLTDTLLGKLTEAILSKSTITGFIYQSHHLLNTVGRYFILVPGNAEKKNGICLLASESQEYRQEYRLEIDFLWSRGNPEIYPAGSEKIEYRGRFCRIF